MNNRGVNKIYNCRMVNGGGDVSSWIVAVLYTFLFFGGHCLILFIDI